MSAILTLFLIAFLGYLLGSVRLFGLKLGTSAVLLVALVFGHFGYEIPGIIRDFGLACFVGSVGFIAGPVFFRGFRKQAIAYVALGIAIIAAGALATVAAIFLFDLPIPLSVGIMAGALTSTPGLAAAMEATGSSMASVGYGIAYPFGVVGVVLFVQLIPKFERADIQKEVALMERDFASSETVDTKSQSGLRVLDSSGMLSLTMALSLGLMISSLVIPLPGGASFSLGVSGGPLLVGLIFGHYGRIGNISLQVSAKTLETFRELGLMLFLIGAGTGAGSGFVEVIATHGAGLFFIGALITLIPMIFGYWLARKLFHLPLLSSLGSICGGMTSTPALGSLISLAGTDQVAASYAATYPVALILVVLACQFISLVLS